LPPRRTDVEEFQLTRPNGFFQDLCVAFRVAGTESLDRIGLTAPFES
jgi:hypothetical protein